MKNRRRGGVGGGRTRERGREMHECVTGFGCWYRERE